MANWFYYTGKGEKIEVTSGELKQLALQGAITPETIVETADGKSAPARKVKGLTFAEANPSSIASPGESISIPTKTTDIVPLPQTQSAIIPNAEPVKDAVDVSDDPHIGSVICPKCGATLEYTKNPSNPRDDIAQQNFNKTPVCCMLGCVFLILFFPVGIVLGIIGCIQMAAQSVKDKDYIDLFQLLVCGECGHHFRSHWKGNPRDYKTQ